MASSPAAAVLAVPEAKESVVATPRVICIIAPMDSGKSSLRDIIVSHSVLPWKTLSFATGVRTAASVLTRNFITVANSQSTAGKSRVVPVEALPATYDEWITLLKVAFAWHPHTAMVTRRAWISAIRRFYKYPSISSSISSDIEFEETVSKVHTLELQPPGSIMTVGVVLQQCGTELARGLFGVRVWVDRLVSEWQSPPRAGAPLVIDDMRFTDEYEYFKEMGAFFVRIDARERLAKKRTSASGSAPTAGASAGTLATAAATTVIAADGRDMLHESEKYAASFVVDLEIQNNGTLEEFRKSVCASKPLVKVGVLERNATVAAPFVSFRKQACTDSIVTAITTPLPTCSYVYGRDSLLGHIYVSGPMSGKLNLNKDAFDRAEMEAKEKGWPWVMNPHKINPATAHGDWAQCMRNDLAALMRCEAILMLPEWRQSDGACLELYNAMMLGMKVYHAA